MCICLTNPRWSLVNLVSGNPVPDYSTKNFFVEGLLRLFLGFNFRYRDTKSSPSLRVVGKEVVIVKKNDELRILRSGTSSMTGIYLREVGLDLIDVGSLTMDEK